jgi:hypothetical protein
VARYQWSDGGIGAGTSRFTAAADPITQAATQQAVELLSRIYALQSAKLWTEDGALPFLYDNLAYLQQNPQLAQAAPARPGPPSPALMRYCNVNARDYDDRVQQLPAEADAVDFDWVDQVLEVGREPVGGFFGGEDGRDMRRRFREALGADGGGPGGARRRHHWLGGPPMNVVDPDWPLLEVFWRSFLPWNRVEGVPPPPPPAPRRLV